MATFGVTFGVLGPVAAWDEAGDALALKGPRHRAVLDLVLRSPARHRAAAPAEA